MRTWRRLAWTFASLLLTSAALSSLCLARSDDAFPEMLVEASRRSSAAVPRWNLALVA